MAARTPLYDAHVAAGAKIVDFHGWDMPLHYGSQIEEHHAVRRGAGMFDVSHMTVVDVDGSSAEAWLRRMLANDVVRLETPGSALYTGMLDDSGGVIDDLIVYRRETGFRLVVNSATRDKDMAWLQSHQDPDVALAERDDLAMIAVQGPQAIELAGAWLEELTPAVAALKPFHAMEDGATFIGRTGYTGEDGIEAILPAVQAVEMWEALAAAGVQPAGLGARDTLRLEAGMNLYGQDMDESVTPYEANMGWTVALDPEDRDFIGRSALEKQKAAGVPRRLKGLRLEGRGVMRRGQQVLARSSADVIGEITSGAFSPTLGAGIAFARLDAEAIAGADACEVDIRGKRHQVKLGKPVFVRRGKVVFDA